MSPLTLDLRTVTAPQAIANEINHACRRARIVHVRTPVQPGCTQEFWEEVLEHHGSRVAVDEDAGSGRPTGSLWSDVEYDPAHTTTFRHSNSAQPLHTDGSYIRTPPAVVFLICQRAASAGGATLFVDGRLLLESLHKEAPRLLNALVSRPLCFSKGGGCVDAPAIVTQDNAVMLRWNFYALHAQLPPEAKQLALQFHTYLQGFVDRRRACSILLQPGEAVFFQDAQVLHGRESFIAQRRGDRCLWKGGLEPACTPPDRH